MRKKNLKPEKMSASSLHEYATGLFIPIDKRKSPGCSFVPDAPTRKATRRDAGRNSHEKEILEILNGMVIPNYASVSLGDVVNLCASMDLPYGEIVEVFENWTARLVKQGKAKPSPLFDNSFLFV